jgi:DNA polymerase III subunit epsilon
MQDLIIKYLPSLSHLNQTSESYITIVDTETTSLADDAEILEFTAIRVYLDDNLSVIGVEQPITLLNEPSCEITAETSKVTGITIDDVRGHHIADKDISDILDGSLLVVAHNAAFDRNHLEKNYKIPNYNWACSMQDIDWFDQNITSKSQEFIAFKYGFWYNAHRAEEDCLSLINILIKNNNILSLFDAAFKETKTVIYTNTPFSDKDVLKKYRCAWDAEGKFWYKKGISDLTTLAEMESNLHRFERDVFDEDPLMRFKW